MPQKLTDEPEDNHWLEVIGRSLAYMCLHSANMAERSLADKAGLLEALGLSRAESARMLGTSYNSLTELRKNSNGRNAKNR